MPFVDGVLKTRWAKGIPVMKYALSLFLAFGALTANTSAHAGPLVIDFDIAVSFDPDAALGIGGFNTQNFIDELFGDGAPVEGAFNASGQITYDPSTALFDANGASAGYFNGITAVDMTIAGVPISADFELIAANAASSEIGFAADASGAFCSDAEGCDLVGLDLNPSGNVIQTINDSAFFVIEDGEITEIEDSDAIAFQMGATDAAGEFGAAITTENFGDISLDAFSLGFFYDQENSPIVDLLLPSEADIFTSSLLTGTLAIFSFDGVGVPSEAFSLQSDESPLFEGISFQGEVTSFSVSEAPEDTDPPAVPVPLPPSLWLLIAGLIPLAFRHSVRKAA